jgi:hypothetical protein
VTTGLPPEPLVPAEVDLRGYDYMPLYGDQLFKSETWLLVSPEAKLAAIRLWWHAFAHEVPSGSLPDNDTLLADYAGYGVMIKAWKRIKPEAMRGFELCSDGRLYHTFLATVVMNAWELRQSARTKGKTGAAKRWEKHRQEKSMPQLSGGNSPGNAPAIENHSNRSEGKEKERGNSTISTRVDPGQGRLKSSLKSKAEAPEDGRSVDERRELARKLASGEIKVGT